MLSTIAACALLPWFQDPGALDLAGFTPRTQTVSGQDGEDLAAVRRARAVWPIANGRIFAYAGYGEPANRLFMITGPIYQTRRNHEPDGAFGTTWIELLRDDEVAAPLERTWTEVVRAAAVRTRETTAGGHVLETVDFALADLPAIVRRVRLVRDPRDRARVGLRIRLDDRPDGPAVLDELALRKTYVRDRSTQELRVSVRPSARISVRGVEGALYVDPVGGGEVVEFEVVLATSRDPQQREAIAAALAGQAAERLQQDALAGWRRQFEGTLTAWPDGPLRQHIESVKKLVLAQRSAPHGGVAPMVSFKGVWARDSNGPLKTFLWMGRDDLARDLLRYYRSASALAGATRREFPLDLPVERAPALSAAEWAKTGTDHVEVPSWIVLQHAWYWHATGDAALIREAYPYLERNALAQDAAEGPHGPLMRFNGDETYLHGAFYALFPQRGVWPNQFPRASAWSLDSLLVWDAALRAMQPLAVVAGHPTGIADAFTTRADGVRRSIARSFWLADAGLFAPALSPVDLSPHRAPFAPINLRPLWLGTWRPDDPRIVANLETTIAMLGRPDGLCRSTPAVAHFIGSLPGTWLANLAAVDHPLAWDALGAVLASASPSGAWAEVHEPSGGPGHSYDATWPNRYRPWESGLVLDGLLRFLTGAEFDGGRAVRLAPRRPRGFELERLGPIPVGLSRLMLHYPKEGRDVRVELVAGPPCLVDGRSLQVGRDLFVPLHEPDPRWTTPEPRAFDGALSRPAGRRLVVTTLGDPEPRDGDVFVDAGLPFAPEHLAALLFDAEGQRRYETVVLEPWARRADRETMKPTAFWDAPALRGAFERFAAAGGRVERPDLVSDWWICGPFPNPDSRGLFDEERPRTRPFDPEQTFPVEGQGVAARWWRRSTPDGRLDLHPPDGPQDDICVFARTLLQSEAERDATLLLGSDDGCRVWLNGALVFESIEHRHLTPDQFRIPVRLRAGENVLIVGVEDRSGGFGLAARLR
jgi:hypothetical protein